MRAAGRRPDGKPYTSNLENTCFPTTTSLLRFLDGVGEVRDAQRSQSLGSVRRAWEGGHFATTSTRVTRGDSAHGAGPYYPYCNYILHPPPPIKCQLIRIVLKVKKFRCPYLTGGGGDEGVPVSHVDYIKW